MVSPCEFRSIWRVEVARQRKVGTLRRSPEHMVCDDFNGDGREDIILMIPREPAHILLSNRQGKLKLAAKTSTVRTGQFVDLTPAEFGVGAMGNDSMPNLLIAKKGYIRSFQLIKMNDQTEDPWSLEVVDQGNARQGKDFIKGPVIVPTEKSIQLVAYDSGEEAVQFLEKDSDNTYALPSLSRYRENSCDWSSSITSRRRQPAPF